MSGSNIDNLQHPRALATWGVPAALSPRSKSHCKTYRFGFSFSENYFKAFRCLDWQRRSLVLTSTPARQ